MNKAVTAVLALALVLALVGSAQADLVGYWTFDGNINDSAGYAAGDHNGTLSGGSYDAVDKPAVLTGSSLNLTGGTDYAIIDQFTGTASDGDFNLDRLTVSAWVKGWPNGNWEPYVSKRGEGGQGWQLRRHGGNDGLSFTLRGHGNDDGPVGGDRTIDNAPLEWHHIVGTYDGATRAYYVDGVLDAELSETGNINDTNANVVFGARDNSDSSGPHTPSMDNYAQIRIDDVAIYDAGLAWNQVEWLAAGGDPKNLPAAAGPKAKGQLDPITGGYYERNNTNQTWDESRVDAGTRQLGGVDGHLATIANADENEAVRQVGGTGDKWIGLHDSDQTSTIDTVNLGAAEGTFQWLNNEGVATYTNWNGGEPNDSGGEDAAHINGNGNWNDHRAGTTLGQTDHNLTSVIEYDVKPGTATLTMRERKLVNTGTSIGDGNGDLNSVAEARALLALPDGHADIAAQGTANVYAVSFQDPDGGGGRSEYIRQAFLTNAAGGDEDFAVQVTGNVYIPAAGDWTFAVSHDDHFELKIGANTFAVGGCCGNPTLINGGNTFNFASAGSYEMDLTWYERGGGAYVQLFAAQGDVSAFSPYTFDLVGDTLNGGLAVRAVPTVLTWDFDDGTAQGWTDVMGTSVANIGGRGAANAGGSFAHDGPHDSLLFRSPQFFLTGDGPLTLLLAGGDGSEAGNPPLPTNESDILAVMSSLNNAGVMGIALRRASDGAYVLTARRSSDDNNFNNGGIIWDEATIAGIMAAYPDEIFTLDLFDTNHGGWGHITIDSVRVPGTPVPEPMTMLAVGMGVAGLGGYVRKRRRA